MKRNNQTITVRENRPTGRAALCEREGRHGPRRRGMCLLLGVLLVLAGLSMASGWMGIAAALAEDGVVYCDEGGNELTHNGVTALNDGTTTWTGWYMVAGNTTISDRITVEGQATLILCDGAKLFASKGITVSAGSSLTIYGQREGTGELEAKGTTNTAAIGGDTLKSGRNQCGAIAIHGGTVTATAGEKGAGIGGGYQGAGGAITITGGEVTATGGKYGAGIGG